MIYFKETFACMGSLHLHLILLEVKDVMGAEATCTWGRGDSCLPATCVYSGFWGSNGEGTQNHVGNLCCPLMHSSHREFRARGAVRLSDHLFPS